MTIRADLGASLETFVSGLVASGRYASEDEVLREAERLFQEGEAKLVSLDVPARVQFAAAVGGNARSGTRSYRTGSPSEPLCARPAARGRSP